MPKKLKIALFYSFIYIFLLWSQFISIFFRNHKSNYPKKKLTNNFQLKLPSRVMKQHPYHALFYYTFYRGKCLFHLKTQLYQDFKNRFWFDTLQTLKIKRLFHNTRILLFCLKFHLPHSMWKKKLNCKIAFSVDVTYV